jgi:hypothetical protein
MSTATKPALFTFRVHRQLPNGNWAWCGDGDNHDGTFADLPPAVTEYAESGGTGSFSIDGTHYNVTQIEAGARR